MYRENIKDFFTDFVMGWGLLVGELNLFNRIKQELAYETKNQVTRLG